MKRDRPGGDHEQVLRMWHGRPGEIIALSCSMSAISFGVCTIAAADTAALVTAWTISGTSAVIAVSYYLIAWRFRLLLRRLRRLAVPPSDAIVWRPPVRSDTDSTREPPEICFRRPVVGPDEPAAPYGHVCVHSNVMGRPPLHITYFRCFANLARTRTFLEGAWSEFGYVHLLRDPNSTTWSERWRARTPEKMAELVVSTEDQLLDRLHRASAEPVRYTDAPYGEYPLREFFCGDAFWQEAADKLIAMADLVVIDLSGLTPESLGLQFELERAFATKRSDQVVVLADEGSDRNYLAELVRRAWTASPATGCPPVVRAYIVDKVVSELVVVPGSSHLGEPQYGRKVELLSDREESRRLLWSILESRNHYP